MTMAPPKKNKGGRPKSLSPKKSLASIKGSEEFRLWLEELSLHVRLPLAILIEHALREYAEAHGFKKPQPIR